jgi:hypothetical protein
MTKKSAEIDEGVERQRDKARQAAVINRLNGFRDGAIGLIILLG